jgi:hypothetical protein
MYLRIRSLDVPSSSFLLTLSNGIFTVDKLYSPIPKLILIYSMLSLVSCGGGGGGATTPAETGAFKELVEIVTWTTDGTGFQIYHSTPLQPKPGDFNNDGYMDFIVTYPGIKNPDTVNFPNGPHTPVPLKIFLNDTNGGFYDGTTDVISGTVPTSLFIRTTQVGDFNGDNLTDVFLGDAPELSDDNNLWAYPDVLLLSNISTGKMEDKSNQLIWTQPNWPATLATLAINERYTHESDQMDFDKDGDIDLLLATSSKSGTVIMVNDGNGVFTEHTKMGQNIGNLNAGSLKSAFSDVNHNGAIDYINPGSDLANGNNAVFINDGTGDFNTLPSIALPPPLLLGGPSSEDIEVTDVNGDGFTDAILLNSELYADGGGQHFIQILINDGVGNFTDETNTRITSANDWVTNPVPLFDVIDMNNDGVKDIVLLVADQVFTHFDPHLNDRTEIWVNVNGVFKLAKTNLPLVLSGLAIADFNNDGMMDIISAYGISNTTDNITFEHHMVLVEGRELITVDE